jgi:hypothetical protein
MPSVPIFLPPKSFILDIIVCINSKRFWGWCIVLCGDVFMDFYASSELTPWSRGLLEKLTVSHLVKKFPALYGTRMFITAFPRARHLPLSWASSIHSKILKRLKNSKSQLFGSWLCFRPRWVEGEKRRTRILLGPLDTASQVQWWRLALSKGPKRIRVLLFSPSIHLSTEAEPASETLGF